MVLAICTLPRIWHTLVAETSKVIDSTGETLAPEGGLGIPAEVSHQNGRIRLKQEKTGLHIAELG